VATHLRELIFDRCIFGTGNVRLDQGGFSTSADNRDVTRFKQKGGIMRKEIGAATIMRCRLLSSTAFGGMLLMAAPAFAQISPTPDSATLSSDPAAAKPDEGIIIVTGSRIANPNLTSASPVVVVGSAEFKQTGTARVEDLVNNLPQVQAAETGSGSRGTATVDLRGIGSTRTLVLINGRRLVPGDPNDPVADLNTIPAALIERVDVLTGGASSVYGSDAIAGVVNFVLDQDFEGFRIDTQYSINQHDNNGDQRIRDALNARNIGYPTGNSVSGAQFDTTVTMGAGFDDRRGHVTAYAGYRKVKSVLQDQFDFSSCSLTPSTTTNTFSCGGSGTTNPAQFQFYRNDFTSLTTQTLNPAVPNGAGFRPYVGSRDAYNFAPTTYFQRPDERFTAGAFADYEISEAIHPYLELSFMDDRSVYQQAESGAFGVEYSIPCDGSNPLISAAQLAVACAPARTAAILDNPATLINEARPAETSVTGIVLRRNSEGGGRQSDLRHTNYRIVLGSRGDLGSNWTYDAYAQFGRTIYSQYYSREFGNTRLNRALDVVRDPATGQAVCRSVVNGIDPACVPYNVYALNGVTDAALNYLQIPLFANGQTTEQIVSGSISNSDFGLKSPLANSGIGFALGAEYRKESIQFRTDTNFTTGEGAGQGGPRLSLVGTPGFNVKEAFGELRIPLVEENFIEELSVEAGYRYSDYSSAGTTKSYKVLANFAPVEGVRFRGGYNRAVRAPNIVELFTVQGLGLFAGEDPCDGFVDNDPSTESPTYSQAQCANTGVTAAQYGIIPDNPANQFQQLTGGNPNLEPEIADTYTLGVVISPRNLLPGFNLSLDYFDIKVENLIGTVGSQIILNQCAETGAPELCSLITRDAAGSLFLQDSGRVVNTNINIGGIRTKGLDVTADYRLPLGGDLGTLNFSLVGTYLDSFVTEPGVINTATGENKYDCVSRYGTVCGRPQPKWRHNLRVTYQSPSNWSLSGRWRFVGGAKLEAYDGNPFLVGPLYIPTASIKDYSYFDLSATVAPTDRVSMRVGVQNLLDKDPPPGNTYSGTYTYLGRYMYIGATLGF
jgi:outer membrane receptor protein involved in Fe transport